jgi:hypothetical protein
MARSAAGTTETARRLSRSQLAAYIEANGPYLYHRVPAELMPSIAFSAVGAHFHALHIGTAARDRKPRNHSAALEEGQESDASGANPAAAPDKPPLTGRPDTLQTAYSC